MRADMAKVVTERPRRGHASESEKFGGRLSKDAIDAELDDHGGERGGFIPWCRRRNIDAKEFTDNLSPLRKYLRKQVGRPWNKVYSELSQTLDKRSLTGLHIWDHIRYEVEVHTRLGADGKIYEKRRNRYAPNDVPVRGLYVHPVTQLLCYISDAFPRYVRRPDPDVVKLDEGGELRKIEGIWYHCVWKTVTWRAPGYWRVFQYPAGTPTHHRYYHEAEDRSEVHQLTKRQLSRGELKHRGLRNDIR